MSKDIMSERKCALREKELDERHYLDELHYAYFCLQHRCEECSFNPKWGRGQIEMSNNSEDSIVIPLVDLKGKDRPDSRKTACLDQSEIRERCRRLASELRRRRP